MTSQADADSFFDSDGDHDQGPSFALKGEYNRGVTPPQLTSSPHRVKPDSNHSKRAVPVTSHYSRSSTSGNYTAESDTMSREKDSSKPYSGSTKSRSRSNSPSYRRSRSPSTRSTRSRSRSHSYSDSFDSEDSRQDSRGASPVRNKKSTRRRGSDVNNRYYSGSSKDSRSSYRSYGTTYTRSTKVLRKAAPKKGGGKTGRSQSVSTLQQSPRRTEVTRRMLSAKGHTINRLRSDVDELQRKYDDAVREVKLMKKLQKRQETALAKFEDTEEELPQLLRSHAAEVDNLRERLRRSQDKEKDKDRRLKEKNEEMNKMNDELMKLRRINEDKRLLDRDKLQRKVDKLHGSLDEKDKRINELEKYLDNIKKNQRHDGDHWKQSEKDYRARTMFLEEENQALKYQLREKEKELDIKNIYSNRVFKPSVKLNTSISPPPTRPLAQTRATSNDDIKKPKQASHPPVKRSSSAEEKRKPEHTPRTKPLKVEEKKPPKREVPEHEKILMELDAGSKQLSSPVKADDDILKQLDDGIKKRERIEDEQRRAEERKKREREDQERRQRKEEEEQRRKEGEDRKRREEAEKKRKQEEERKERERKQREEEERRQEEDLASHRKKQEESDRLTEERRKKDMLLARMKEIDTGKPDSRQKEYKFTQPIENLHNGRPSHPDMLGSASSGEKKKPANDDLVFGGYAPSYGRRAAAGDKPAVKNGGLFDDDENDGEVPFGATKQKNQSNQKTDLMSNLFGDNGTNTPSKSRSSFEGTVFSTSTKAKPVADSTALPWEKKTNASGSLFTQQNVPNGLAINMPRSSIDDIDDDLEELVL